MSICLWVGRIIPHDKDIEDIKRLTEDPSERGIVDYYFDKIEYKFYNMIPNYMKFIKGSDRRKYRRVKRNFDRFKKSVENINPDADYSTEVLYSQLHDLNNKFMRKRKCTYAICFSKESMLDFLNRYKYYYHDKREKIISYMKLSENLGHFPCPDYRYHDFLKVYQQFESVEWEPGYFFICAY